MRKYDRRILTALVIAYKKGIINKKPLKRWTNQDEIFSKVLRYCLALAVFAFAFILFHRNLVTIFEMDTKVYFYGNAILKSKIVSGLILGIISINFYFLGKYIYQIFFVRKALKRYSSEDFNVEKLNNVTFKIHM